MNGIKDLGWQVAYYQNLTAIAQTLLKLNELKKTFRLSLHNSIPSAAQQLQTLISIVNDIAHKKLQLYANKLQLLYELKPDEVSTSNILKKKCCKKWKMKFFFTMCNCFQMRQHFSLSGIVNRQYLNMQIKIK